ncbi:MAG: ABC transporter permease subunit [Caldisericum sp.]|jgi:putative spermidine/putrescine transport system permease protein|nr:ABC transporter permease subunit [Caldisericum sp.]
MKKSRFWAWFWIFLGALYFLLPLFSTFLFSLKMKKGVLSFAAYQSVLKDPQFFKTFTFSLEMSVLTIIVGLAIIVPTAFWVRLRLKGLRPIVEFITQMPFVVPPIVLVFGLIRLYSKPPVQLTRTPLLLVMGYVVLSLPYIYRSVDNGLMAMDVERLTEAAESLGAGWTTILFKVILPNLKSALISGTFLTFAIVIGELTMASMLAWPAFGPYMALLGQNRAYEPAALAIMSFALTWAAMGVIQWVGRTSFVKQEQVGGIH